MTGQSTKIKDDPQAFLEARYPAWDLNRHGVDNKAMPLWYRLTRNPPEAIHFRKHVVLEYIKTHGQGKHVVELGCGTGRMGPIAIDLGAASYHGIDFAQSAIDIARENAGDADNITFEQANILDKQSIDADLVFSSGFISWLTDAQIDHMFAVTQQTHYLHSITEPRWDLRQIVKNTYQFFTEADPFVVRYFSVKDMQQVIEKHRRDEMHALRHKKLYTLAYISSLPYPDILKDA